MQQGGGKRENAAEREERERSREEGGERTQQGGGRRENAAERRGRNRTKVLISVAVPERNSTFYHCAV